MRLGYVYLTPGGIPDGGVARTVEVTDSLMVDVDAHGTVLGVETLGDASWTDALLGLAMQGRLRVTFPA